MQDLTRFLASKANAFRLNTNLETCLAHCPNLEASGWSFRCTLCHVASGTYPRDFGWDWHSHTEYQIEIPLTGTFEFETAGGKKTPLTPGRALVIPSKLAHRWKCLKSGTILGISLELQPTPQSIRQDGRMIEQADLVIGSSIRRAAIELVQSALNSAHPKLRDRVVAARLFLLLAEVMERVFPEGQDGDDATFQQAAETRGRETVASVVRYLEENLDRDVSLDHIARKVGHSGRHLHRLFLKHVGKSVHDYLLERRLEKARQMLIEKGKSVLVKEIAFACGFHSLTYFSKCFRNVYGVVPSTMLSQHVRFTSRNTWMVHSGPQETADLPQPNRKYSLEKSIYSNSGIAKPAKKTSIKDRNR